MLAIVGRGFPTVLWDLSDPAHPRPIATNDESSSLASFTPDGRTLILVASTAAKRLDVSHPDQPARKIELTGIIGLSADAHLAVTRGNSMNSAVLWNIADPTHPDRRAMLTGLPSWPTGATFSPDGHTLALQTHDDESVSLWDVTDPAIPHRNSTLRSADMASGRVSFSGDGRTLVTNAPGPDEIAALWDLSGLRDLRRAPATVACVITGGGFSTGDWERYIPDVPYRRTC
jgi:WD40 repeat protein